MELDGKVALITGAGSGIGEAIAKAFVAAGARILVTEVNEEAGARLAKELGDRHCRFEPGDHRSREDNDRAVRVAVDAWGGLDILLNNAGTAVRGPIETVGDTEVDRLLGVNIAGPYRMTQAALPALRERARSGATPSILFTASMQSLMVKPDFTLYGTTKHAIAGLVGSLALELAPAGIRVNAVCPGPVDTPLLRAGLANINPDVEQALKDYVRDIPMRKLTPLADIAETAVFLCSDRARIMTGSLVAVDGGISAR